MDMARTFYIVGYRIIQRWTWLEHFIDIVGYRIIQRWTWLGHFIDSSVLDNSKMDIGHG